MNRLVPSLAFAVLLAGPAAAAPQSALPEGVAPFEVAALTEKKTGFYGRFGLTNCAWLDLGDGILVVDTGATATDAANLRSQIDARTPGKKVKWVALTHLHADSNGALADFLGNDPVTIFVNATYADRVRDGILVRAGRKATVVGVAGRATIETATNAVELVAPAGAAHTDGDLLVFSPSLGAAFVGDVVTSGRCPMVSDNAADPVSWLVSLDFVTARHPALLVPTRGDASAYPDAEVEKTRAYLKRLVDLLTELKAKKAPEAELASRLRFLASTGDYCPRELDSINASALYRRMTDGGTWGGAPAKRGDAKAAPARKK